MIGERREARTKSQAQTQLFLYGNEQRVQHFAAPFVHFYISFVRFFFSSFFPFILLKGFIRWILCSLQLLENEFLITESIILSCVKSLFLGIVHSVYFY